MLSREVIRRLADQLLDDRLDLLREIRVVEEDLSDLQAKPVSDREERGQEADQADALSHLDDAARTRLSEIDEALGRVARGEYGRCVRCHAHIALERLEAMPAVRQCLRCASESEQPGTGAGSPTIIRR
jgi:DnaK suppressor protein